MGYLLNRTRLVADDTVVGRLDRRRVLSWFSTDDDCLDYLEWLRWPGGFVCPDCGHAGGWRLGDGRVKCGGCGSRTSVTAGTIFDKTRTPLTVWFHACWLSRPPRTASPPSTCSGCWRSALSDGVGNAAPASVSAGAAGRDRLSGTARSMRPTRRRGARFAGRAAARQEGPHRDRRGGSRAEGHRPRGWRRSMTPAVTRWARSSPRTCSQGRRSSLTAGPLPGHQRQGISAPAHQPESGPRRWG